jgi:CRP-like cAMP-binding protein
VALKVTAATIILGAILTRALEAYATLTQEDRAAFAKLTQRSVREVAARRDLIREGDRPQHIYLLLEGWASRYKTLPDGRRQTVAFFLPGDMFDTEVLPLREMDHSVGAITPLTVSEIERAAFDTLMAERPRLAQALWRQNLAAVAVQREWTLNVGQRTAFERIAHILCELFLRLRAAGRTTGDSCDFPLTQVDLAEATGLTAVHVNRTLQELRKVGLIELQQRVLTIPDLGGLKEAGLFNDNYLHLAPAAD